MAVAADKNEPLRVITPADPPELTPGAAQILLRILRNARPSTEHKGAPRMPERSPLQTRRTSGSRPEFPRAEDVPTLKVPQVADFLGVGVSTAYAAINAGEIPSIRLGGRIVVPTAALRRLLALDVEEPDRRSEPG